MEKGWEKYTKALARTEASAEVSGLEKERKRGGGRSDSSRKNDWRSYPVERETKRKDCIDLE